jgi:hypothetical protein
MMSIKYDSMLTKELISIKKNLEKRIEKLISDHNGLVDILRRRSIASAEEGWSLFSETGAGNIVYFS